MLLGLLQRDMEKKWHSSLFPPLPASNMSAVAKKVIMMEKLFIFGEPHPSLLKTTQEKHLKPDSAKEAYLSSTQHAGDFLRPTYNTLVCTAQHNVCSLCNVASLISLCTQLMISLCTQLSSVELLPVQSSSTLHLHTWVLLSKPNILHFVLIELHPRLLNSLASLSHPSGTVTIQRFISQCYMKFT